MAASDITPPPSVTAAVDNLEVLLEPADGGFLTVRVRRQNPDSRIPLTVRLYHGVQSASAVPVNAETYVIPGEETEATYRLSYAAFAQGRVEIEQRGTGAAAPVPPPPHWERVQKL